MIRAKAPRWRNLFLISSQPLPDSPTKSLYARPSAHLPALSTRGCGGTIFRSSGVARFVQGGVVKTFRCATSVKKNPMTSFPPMDRSVAKLTTLAHQGTDSGVPNATPAERLLMVWPLTLTAWSFKEPNVVQPRLQRHVARVIRSED